MSRLCTFMENRQSVTTPLPFPAYWTAVVGLAVFQWLVLPSVGHADNWPNWRGPHQTGLAEGTGYATSWSVEKNVVWKLAIPGRGASTPVVWGDHIFLTYVEEAQNIAVCFDRQGEKTWQRELGESREAKSRKASGANSSPVTDGTNVYFYFKSGDLACLNFDGDVVWRKNLQKEFGEDKLWWDLGTSPVLSKDSVIVACQQTGDSYIVAFEKASGKVVWKHSRDLNAPVESNQSYTTPLLIENDGQETLIVVGADHVTAHRISDGSETWRVGDLNPDRIQSFRSIASAVASEETVYVPYARGRTLTAIRLDGVGDVTDSHISWTSTQSSDIPTPAYAHGRLYICRDRDTATCLESKTGKVVWNKLLSRLPEPFSASPIIADGHVYLTREDGTTFVVKDSDEFELVATNELREQTVATPVFVDGKIYLRTYDHLYCIGQPVDSSDRDLGVEGAGSP